jgi:hypothetical protein
VSAASLRNRVYPVWEASSRGSSRSLEGDPASAAWSRDDKGQPDKMCTEPRCGGGQPKSAGQPVATGGQCSQPDKVGAPKASGDWHEPWQRGEPVRLSHRPVGHPAIAASLQPPGVGTTRQLVRVEPRGARETRHSSVPSTRAAKVGSTRCPFAWWAACEPDGKGANPQVTAQGGEPRSPRSTQKMTVTRAEPGHRRSTHFGGATGAEPLRARSTQVEEATPPEPSLQRPTRAVVAPLSQPVFPRPTRPEGAWEEPSRTRSTQNAEATRGEPRLSRSTHSGEATRSEPSVTRATLVRRAVCVKPARLRATQSRPATRAEPRRGRSTHHPEATRAEPELPRSTQSLWRQHAEPRRGRSTHFYGALVQEPHITRSTHRRGAPVQEPSRKGQPLGLGTAQALPAQGNPRGRAVYEQDNPSSVSTAPLAVAYLLAREP